MDAEAPVDSSAREADVDAIGDRGPGGVLGRAVKADLRHASRRRRRRGRGGGGGGEEEVGDEEEEVEEQEGEQQQRERSEHITVEAPLVAEASSACWWGPRRGKALRRTLFSGLDLCFLKSMSLSWLGATFSVCTGAGRLMVTSRLACRGHRGQGSARRGSRQSGTACFLRLGAPTVATRELTRERICYEW